MIERLRFIAEKYGLGADARQELEELLGGSGPQAPTRRIPDDENGDSSPPPALLPLDQKTFRERYEDLGHLGTGGFSEVREVRDVHVGRRVALKEQLPSVASPDDCARFQREVAITAKVE